MRVTESTLQLMSSCAKSGPLEICYWKVSATIFIFKATGDANKQTNKRKTCDYFVYAYFQKIHSERKHRQRLQKHINNCWSAQQLLDLNFHFFKFAAVAVQ